MPIASGSAGDCALTWLIYWTVQLPAFKLGGSPGSFRALCITVFCCLNVLQGINSPYPHRKWKDSGIRGLREKRPEDH